MRDAAGSLEIIVDDSVKDLKVTANIHKWPLGKVLDLLIAQADLACSSDRTEDGLPGPRDMREEDLVNAPTTKLYLVPKPELSVSGVAQPHEGRIGPQPMMLRRQPMTFEGSARPQPAP